MYAVDARVCDLPVLLIHKINVNSAGLFATVSVCDYLAHHMLIYFT